MNEADFHRLADATLGAMFDALEQADEAGKIDVDYQAGVITITLSGGRQFIVNKHAPSRQIWLSSPVSGGLHFPFDAASDEWKLADGRVLGQLLSQELQTLAHIEVTF